MTSRKKKAVALEYSKNDIAPKIIAKGQGKVAERIIEVDANSADISDPANKAPLLIDLLKNRNSIRPSMTTNRRLHFHHRFRKQQDNGDVDEDKDATTATISKIRELPYISYAYRAPCADKDKSDPGSETLSLLFHKHFLI